MGARGGGSRVLGVDPGSVVTGWGIIDDLPGKPRYVASGVLRLAGSRAERLGAVHAAVAEILKRHRPTVLALEKSFVGPNVQTAFRLGEVRGSVMAAVAGAGVDVAEYAPAAIKLAVTGSGRALKAQIQKMVLHMLALDAVLRADEADALAAALCHLHACRGAALLPAAALDGRRSRRSQRDAWEAFARR